MKKWVMYLLARIFGKTYIGVDYASGKDKGYKCTSKMFRGKWYVIKVEELN